MNLFFGIAQAPFQAHFLTMLGPKKPGQVSGSRKTVCLNDISIIALAKTLNVPVVSMEERVTAGSKKLHIPDVCDLEGVEHLRFSEFLRKEKLKF
jgi:hypothetical protein